MRKYFLHLLLNNSQSLRLCFKYIFIYGIIDDIEIQLNINTKVLRYKIGTNFIIKIIHITCIKCLQSKMNAEKCFIYPWNDFLLPKSI